MCCMPALDATTRNSISVPSLFTEPSIQPTAYCLCPCFLFHNTTEWNDGGNMQVWGFREAVQRASTVELTQFYHYLYQYRGGKWPFWQLWMVRIVIRSPRLHGIFHSDRMICSTGDRWGLWGALFIRIVGSRSDRISDFPLLRVLSGWGTDLSADSIFKGSGYGLKSNGADIQSGRGGAHLYRSDNFLWRLYRDCKRGFIWLIQTPRMWC